MSKSSLVLSKVVTFLAGAFPDACDAGVARARWHRSLA